jgi:hypothetical protein
MRRPARGRTRREIFNILDDEICEALTELSEAPFVEPQPAR